MADDGSIVVTGAAGRLGAVGRTVTGLLLESCQHVPDDRLPDEHSVHDPEPAATAALAQRAARIASGASKFFPAPMSERLQLVRCIHTRRRTGLRPRMRNRLEYHHGEVFVHLSRIHGEPCQAVS